MKRVAITFWVQLAYFAEGKCLLLNSRPMHIKYNNVLNLGLRGPEILSENETVIYHFM
jgi:hypothetical protein